MRRVVVAFVLVAGLAMLAACDGGSPSMDDGAAVELRAGVTAVRTAVVARDADGAERAVDDLRQTVHRLRRDEALSDERAADILAAASDVDDQLVTITTTTTTTTTTATTTTTTVPTAPPTVDDNGNKGKDKGGGKGKG